MISPALLIEGYLHGVFPMGMEDGEIGWFSPDPRAIIPLDDSFHVPHGLKRALARRNFELRVDRAFEAVMRACAAREETWITDEIVESYCELHRRGYAHSVEAWRDEQLAGGLYGVAIGGAFFGESMFHHETDASKVALYGLVQRLRERGYKLLDTQWITPHLKQFGAREIPRREYLRQLAAASKLTCSFL
jgi:leucyl/phenylalanyl-tRNA--protein transferase